MEIHLTWRDLTQINLEELEKQLDQAIERQTEINSKVDGLNEKNSRLCRF